MGLKKLWKKINEKMDWGIAAVICLLLYFLVVGGVVQNYGESQTSEICSSHDEDVCPELKVTQNEIGDTDVLVHELRGAVLDEDREAVIKALKQGADVSQADKIERPLFYEGVERRFDRDVLCYLLQETDLQHQIPDESWVPIYFNSIVEVVEELGMESLVRKELEPDDQEIRIWMGFGQHPFRKIGLILKYRSDSWSAEQIYAKHDGTNIIQEIDYDGDLEEFVTQLRTYGIFDLPDGNKVRGGPLRVFDGIGYVIEYQKKGMYRTYLYSNPAIYYERYDAGDEFKQMVEMMDFVREEIDLF